MKSYTAVLMVDISNYPAAFAKITYIYLTMYQFFILYKILIKLDSHIHNRNKIDSHMHNSNMLI